MLRQFPDHAANLTGITGFHRTGVEKKVADFGVCILVHPGLQAFDRHVVGITSAKKVAIVLIDDEAEPRGRIGRLQGEWEGEREGEREESAEREEEGTSGRHGAQWEGRARPGGAMPMFTMLTKQLVEGNQKGPYRRAPRVGHESGTSVSRPNLHLLRSIPFLGIFDPFPRNFAVTGNW